MKGAISLGALSRLDARSLGLVIGGTPEPVRDALCRVLTGVRWEQDSLEDVRAYCVLRAGELGERGIGFRELAGLLTE